MNKITLGIVAALFSASASASWSIVDIGGLGGNGSSAVAINDLGQITGLSMLNNSSSWHAYITDANGSNIRDISSISAPNSDFIPSGINNLGQVVGNYANQISGISEAFVTGVGGQGMTKFSIGAGIGVSILDINDSGVILGSYNENGYFRSFTSDSDGSNIKGIGDLSGLAVGPNEINNSGQAVGSYLNSSSGRDQAFIINNDGSIRDLSETGEKYYKGSMAFDVNNSGQVAGILSTDNHRWSQAFITGDDGNGIIKLGTIPGLWGGYAVAINDAGQAVGISRDITGSEVGSFIYANGGLTDLSNLPEVIDAGWSSIFVTDINNNGQIIGRGFHESDPDNLHSFLLSFTSDTVFTPYDFYIPPIPEPSTYLMLLAGLGLLGFMRYKHK